jgi:hypothetical protein
MIHGNHPPTLFNYALSPVLPSPRARQPGEAREAAIEGGSGTSSQAEYEHPLRRRSRAAGLTAARLSAAPAATLAMPAPVNAASSPELTANRVAQQFAERPTLRSVVSGLLSEALKTLYPTLAFDLEYTALAEPISSNPPQYCLTPLLDVALKHLTTDGELDFTDKEGIACTLIDQATGHTLKPAPLAGALVPGIDMQAIEMAIRSLRTALKRGFEQALLRHFTGNAYTTQRAGDAQTNRWLWLSDTLRDTLRTAALKQPGLTEQQRDTLDQIVSYPNQAQRVRAKGDTAASVFILEAAVRHDDRASAQLSPDLLITREVAGRTQVLHATPAGVVTAYDSLQAFGEAWGRNLEKAFVFDSLDWKRQAPDANIFDIQAATLLNAMLENVASIRLPASGTLDELDQVFSRASDPSPWFAGSYTPNATRLGRLRDNLPAWLSHASDAERDAYRHHSLALASSVQRNNGRTFLDGIPDIRTFARQQLDQQLAGKGYTAQDLEVVFKVAVGDLGSGYIEREKMSLVDMALNNLAGLPKGQMEVYLRGQPVSDPHMPQMLKNLVSSVDIGSHYPQLLNRELQSDSPSARDRTARFIEQVPIQLAMQALELKLKGEAGITDLGYRFIEAVTHPGVGSKQVDGQAITVRPLAFVRKPGATPDVAVNMFLIEPLAATNGPHILYRPLLKPALLEFPSRDALLEAIRTPGALQESILAWLKDDKARAVYGNGGFQTPNISRYSVFNEFDPPTTPTPTALAVDGYATATTLRQDVLNGDLMKHWFHTNADSLVTLAEGQSTSDAESRWASHKELGWLLFNTLLPVLRGPGAMAGWLLQLANSEEDIKRLSTPNDQDPSSAVVDLLVNLGMTLGHASASEPGEPARTFEPFKQDAHSDSAGPRPRHDDEPVARQAIIRQAPAAPASGSFGGENTAIDVRLSTPRGLTPSLLAHIDSFKVAAPTDPGSPIAEGTRKGLYTIHDRLYANIDHHWFRVANDLDGAYVIDEHNKARTAPPITRDAQGKWHFDLAPKLRGGMPKSARPLDSLANSMQAKRLAETDYRRNLKERKKVSKTHDTAMANIEADLTEYESARKKLKTLYNLASTEASAVRFAEPYAQQRQITDALKDRIAQQLERLKPLTQSLVAASKTTVETIAPRKLGGIDDLSEFKHNRSVEYENTLHTLTAIENFYVRLFNDTRQYGVRGASISELEAHANSGIQPAYEQLTEAYKIIYENNKQLLRSRQAVGALLAEWKSDSPFGNKEALGYIKRRYTTTVALNELTTKLNNLSFLHQLTSTWGARFPEDAARRQMERFLKDNLKAEASALQDLRQYNDFTLGELYATLYTIITKYKQVLSDSLVLQEEYPQLFRADYHQRFTALLSEFIADAQAELAQVVKEEQFLIPAAPARSDQRAKPQNQRVFKTEHKETLIGTLRAPEPGRTVDIIDVLDPQSGQPIASYSEHAKERGWVKIIRGQPTQTSPAASPKPLASYKSDAQKSIDAATRREQSILFQKKKLDDPQRRDTVSPLDWYEMLETVANQLKETARQAEANHGGRPETAELVARWRTAADEMLQKARQHTADGYLVQPPTAENVDFLWRHRFVDINLVRRDVPTKAGDVFTEYAVRKKGKIDVVWYAHFHYPQKGWPRDDHRAAHLKIPSQRYKTKKDLIAEAKSNGVVAQIINADINAPLDQKLFLKL